MEKSGVVAKNEKDMGYKTIVIDNVDNAEPWLIPTDSNQSSESPGSIVTQRNTYTPKEKVIKMDEDQIFDQKVLAFRNGKVPENNEIQISQNSNIQQGWCSKLFCCNSGPSRPKTNKKVRKIEKSKNKGKK